MPLLPIETAAEVVQQGIAVWEAWGASVDQFNAWLAGTPDGGPNGDGRYPMTNRAGVTVLVQCPAAVLLLVQTEALEPIAPYDHIEAITPNDGVDVGPFGAIYVGNHGGVTVLQPNDEEAVFSDCFPGQIIEVKAKRVLSATTAGSLVGLSRLDAPVLPIVEDVVTALPADIDLPEGIAFSIFVGGGGSGKVVSLRAADGSTASFNNVPSSRRLPVRTRQVRAATTATNLLALY